MMMGNIFTIQRFSIHDGPGIRTTVFFKDCNLRCWWCHNPESWGSEPVLMLNPQNCIGCRACVKICPCHCFAETGHVIDRKSCTGCGKCAAACPSNALELYGNKIDSDALLSELLKDAIFYEKSGGGITFSGGECLLQSDFLGEMLGLCRANSLHTAIDTAGNTDFSIFERLLPDTDLFLYDLKSVDSAIHQKGTGADNTVILKNLSALLQKCPEKIWIRIPVIPGFNNNKEEMQKIHDFLSNFITPAKIELMPYHRLGEIKHKNLGLPLLKEIPVIQSEEADLFYKILRGRNGRRVLF
jgi:pyruvate formate lyase activating enzyme